MFELTETEMHMAFGMVLACFTLFTSGFFDFSRYICDWIRESMKKRAEKKVGDQHDMG